ncbi:hypothetical protein IWQ55_006399 [Labrenzia sp. EL_208]|nr:hypothetical protein [Labrenzia sp. EL_132]MBG6233164.1 hypothetical protein [Labrenzia sp. EL_208]
MPMYDVKTSDMEWTDAVRASDWDAAGAAETAAHTFWNENDGWEWMKDGADFEVRQVGQTEVVKVSISVDFEPVFYGTENSDS